MANKYITIETIPITYIPMLLAEALQKGEESDNQVEDYFFKLVLRKTSIVEKIGFFGMLTEREVDTGRTITWLSPDDKRVLIRILWGETYAGEDLKEYIEAQVLPSTWHLRSKIGTELGLIFSFILGIIERLMDIPDSDAMRFIMHEKKEHVELHLLQHIDAGLTEMARECAMAILSYREMLARSEGNDYHELEVGEIAKKLYATYERLSEQYSMHPELLADVEAFRRANAMFKRKF